MAQHRRETIGNKGLENWELLGTGGFGFVYSAEHKDGKVAIKLPHDDGSGQSYVALCREADYMEAANKQYVPIVYGMYQGRPPGLGSKVRQGIVMELMEGGSLQSFLQTLSKPPPWPLAFRLANQVALAMDFVHSKNLVHMDLKADNILLDAKLNAKIADFGLTTVSNSVLETAGKGDKGGTLAFIPPEAFEDDYHRVRSYDVYSYSILLWTILTGDNKPYPGLRPGGNHSYVKLRIQMGDRPLLDRIDVHQAVGLEDLVELMKRCWETEPQKRPSFKECIKVTSHVFSRHEKEVDAAVYEILTKESTATNLKELKHLEGEPDLMAPTNGGPCPTGLMEPSIEEEPQGHTLLASVGSDLQESGQDLASILQQMSLAGRGGSDSANSEACLPRRRLNFFSSLRLRREVSEKEGEKEGQKEIRTILTRLIEVSSQQSLDLQSSSSDEEDGHPPTNHKSKVSSQIQKLEKAVAQQATRGQLKRLPKAQSQVSSQRQKRKREKAVAQQAKLKCLNRTQTIQRQLEEVEEKHRDLEERGVAIEKMHREETDDNEKAQLYQSWSILVLQRNRLLPYESELVIFAQELELEYTQGQLQMKLRRMMSVEDEKKTASDLHEEREILNKIMDVVQRRDALVDELTRQRERAEDDPDSVLEKAHGSTVYNTRSSKMDRP